MSASAPSGEASGESACGVASTLSQSEDAAALPGDAAYTAGGVSRDLPYIDLASYQGYSSKLADVGAELSGHVFY